MPQPFDYSIGAPVPFSLAFQQGLGANQDRRALAQDMVLADTQNQRAEVAFGQNNVLFDQGQQDRVAAQAAAQAEAEAMAARQAAVQADLSALGDAIEGGTATAADFAGVTLRNPELATELKGIFDGLSTERKAADTAFAARALTAIKSGSPEVAIAMLEERADAARAAGNLEEADTSAAMAATIRARPEAGVAALGMMLTVADPEVAKLVLGEGVDPAERYRNVGDSLIDLEAPGGPAAVDLGITSAADPKAVQELRKEWVGLPAVKTFQTQSDSYGRILASATAPSGAGDVALVYSYMKMLDPGSVVREGEFATAEQTGGIDQRIVGIYNRLIDGERLTPEMRADFVSRAQGIYKNAEGEYNSLRGQYEGIAKRQGFSVDDALPDFRYSGERDVPGDGSGSLDPAAVVDIPPDDPDLLKYGGGAAP